MKPLQEKTMELVVTVGRLLYGPWAVWICYSIARDLVLVHSDPSYAAGFLLGLIMGGPLWFIVKVSLVTAVPIAQAAWRSLRHKH